MGKVIDVEAQVTDVVTPEGLFKLGLGEDELKKEVAIQALRKLGKYEQDGLTLETVVTPESRGVVKDIRGKLVKDIAQHKADLEELKEKELKRFTIFEQVVLDGIVYKLEELRLYGDVEVKKIEASMLEERTLFASKHWDELNKLTPVTKTYEDLMFKVSMNDNDTKIQKALKEIHDAEVAKELQISTERSTLALMPRAERLLALYDSGLTMAECIIKDQEEEAVRAKVIAEESERIARLATEKEAQARANILREEAEAQEKVRLEALRLETLRKEEEQRAQQAPERPQSPQMEHKEVSLPNTPTTPSVQSEPLNEPKQTTIFAEKTSPVLREITIDVIGTEAQFKDLMLYAHKQGIQVTGKPTVKLATIDDIFGKQK